VNQNVYRRNVVFFTEYKYGEVTTQTYAAVAGQRYFIKSGSNYINLRDMLVTAYNVRGNIARAATYTLEVVTGVYQGRLRRYDPILVAGVKPLNTTWRQDMINALKVLLARI
jgi:hypothetical protein